MKNRSAKIRPGSKNSLVAFVVGEVHYAIDVQHVPVELERPVEGDRGPRDHRLRARQ